jgi:uncharacterized FAD-dependent dehydrogenase
MPILIRNLILTSGAPEEQLREEVLRRFRLTPADLLALRMVRSGIDARKKPRIRLVCTVECSLRDEADFLERFAGDPDVTNAPPLPPTVFPRINTGEQIVIVGTGPAGLFAALRLAEYGITATLLERGRPVPERLADVQRFWSRGELDPESNVQFGEGGAGTFSDGKLTTRVRDTNITWVLEQLVRFGAPPEVLILAKPHIGTDRLREVVVALREHLAARGFDIRFQAKLTGLAVRDGNVAAVTVNDREELPAGTMILAPGHSARDTYRMLTEHGVRMEQKPFAVGVRVEHPQELINRIQYGHPAPPHLPSADYGVTYNNHATGRSAYSFCMCPGGVLMAGSSEAGGIVTNGMSNHHRNSPYANSALVVNVGPADFPGSGPLAGIEFQREWERRAFEAGGRNYHAPGQNLLDFLDKRLGRRYASSYRPGVRECDLAAVLPDFVSATLREGIRSFDKKMKGFVTEAATLTGVETRTSAPLRIVRGEDCQSVTLRGLYPTGEGAGYAGGIMSAALDGIRVADAVAKRLHE